MFILFYLLCFQSTPKFLPGYNFTAVCQSQEAARDRKVIHELVGKAVRCLFLKLSKLGVTIILTCMFAVKFPTVQSLARRSLW